MFASSDPHVSIDIIQKIHLQLRPFALISWVIIVQIKFVKKSDQTFPEI